MRNRTVGINVRVTPAEKHRMESAARRCGLTLSEYLRQRALPCRTATDQIRDALLPKE